MKFKSISLSSLLCTLALFGACRNSQTGKEAGTSTPKVQVPAQQATFHAPEGFTVELVAGAEITGSVVNMTFDSHGRPVISREGGAVTALEDRDGDGKFETAVVFTDKIKNCQGLCFVGNALYAVGDVPVDTKDQIRGSEDVLQDFAEVKARNIEDARNAKPSADGKPANPRGVTGLYRIEDKNGDGVGDEITAIGLVRGGMGEHGPHAVMTGPDGLLYFVIGNHAWPAASSSANAPHTYFAESHLLPIYLDPRGHARDIRAPGGTIWRLDMNGNRWERFAGGFRNQYDAAFNLLGEMFTFDSDMEWDLNLPWYRPCRTVHVVPGGDFGWRTGSGNWPDYFADSLPPLKDTGRGSPVGMEFYQSHAFPSKYFDALFMGDWSRGRILVQYPKKSGATYSAEVEEFVTGEPMNVTDLAIGPDGGLYFVNGGRATDGGLYRVKYTGKVETSAKQNASPVEAALDQAQPRSAWGRESIRNLREKAGADWEKGLRATIADARAEGITRARALELLIVSGPGLDKELLIKLGKDSSWEMRAASTYYLGMLDNETATRELITRLGDSDNFVKRRACEALIRLGVNPGVAVPKELLDADLKILGDADRNVRFASRLLLERLDRNSWRRRVLSDANPRAAINGLIALTRTMRGSAPDMDALLTKELSLLGSVSGTDERLQLLRAIHLTLISDEGVLRAKYYNPLGIKLLEAFPASDYRLSREYARTLAYLQTPGAIDKVLTALQKETNTEQQIFYAYCLRNMKGEWKPEQQEAMIGWFAKTQKEQWKGGASFTGYLEFTWNSWLLLQTPENQTKAKARLAELAPAAVANAGEFARKAGNMTLSNQELTEYLLLDPMAYRMTANTLADGRKAFEKAGCILCHKYGDIGNSIGPDLTEVGRRFKRKDLIEAIIYPSKTISDQFQAVEVKTNDGHTYLGVIENQDNSQVTLRLVSQEKVSIPVSNIKSREVSKTSLMPEGLLNSLDVGETASLLLFLEKGNRAGK